MKLKIISVLILLFSVYTQGKTPENAGETRDRVKTKMELLNDMSVTPFTKMEWTGRKVSAVVLSALIPGSGQTYLGETWKGAAFTLAFYGTAVAAVVAHNNFLAREDRIKVLTREYTQQNTYTSAERIWAEIKAEENNRKYDDQRRKIFTYSAAGIWLLNIIDVIFISEDKGSDAFSLNNYGIPAELNFALQENYSGVALKFNLP